MNNIKNSISFLLTDNIELIEGTSTHSFPIHTHQVFCIGIVTRGSLRFIINNLEYSLRENSIYLVPPGKSHSIYADNHHEYSYLAICIRNLFPQTDFLNYTREDQTAADKIIKLSQEFKRMKNARALKEGLVSTLTNLFEYNSRLPLRSGTDITDKAAVFIGDNLDKPFNLRALAINLNISRFYLSRIFKKRYGLTPQQFFTQAKVKKVRQELLRNHSPALVAYELGFTDQSHLCRTFKKYMGISPQQFKNNYTNV